MLDGACELALGIAAEEVGADIAERDSLLDIYSKVSQRLPAGKRPRGGKALRELHRSRNNVQHHGVLPAATNLPVWAVEVERFIEDLVRVVFDEEIAALRAAFAVVDEQLQKDLLNAEAALDSREWGAALTASSDAINRALRSFRSVRGRQSTTTLNRVGRESREFREIVSALETFERFTDVAYLAADPGEWLWLRAAVAEHRRTGESPGEADARRAYAFALNWILRYESFRARYPERKIPDYETASPFEEYSPPRVVHAGEARRPAFTEGHVALELQLEGVLPEWDFDVFDAMSELVAEGIAPEKSRAIVSRAGALELQIPDSLSDVETLALADALMERTHSRFQARMADRRLEYEAAHQMAAPYEEAIAGQPSPIRGIVMQRAGRDDTTFVIGARLDLPDDVDQIDLQQAINSAVASTERARGVYVADQHLWFAPTEISPEQLISVVMSGIETARANKLERDNELAAVTSRRDDLVRGVNRLVQRRQEPEHHLDGDDA